MNTNSSFNMSIIVGLIIIGLLIVLFLQFKRKKYKPNYRLFFILGTTWVPLGVIFYITQETLVFL